MNIVANDDYINVENINTKVYTQFKTQEQIKKAKDRPQPALPQHCTPWVYAESFGIVIKFCLPVIAKVIGLGQGKIRIEYDSSFDDIFGFKVIDHFAPGHFGVSTGYRFKTENEIGVLLKPLPNNRSDLDGVLEGFIETWWFPKPLFLVYKAPEKNQELVFNPGAKLAIAIPMLKGKIKLGELSLDEKLSLVEDQDRYISFSSPPHDNLSQSSPGVIARPYSAYSRLINKV